MQDERPFDSWAMMYDELYTNLFGSVIGSEIVYQCTKS